LNTTISTNVSGAQGGGVYNAAQNTEIINSTITLNDALAGGGIRTTVTTNPLFHVNSIVADNTDQGTAPDVYGTLDSGSTNNLIGLDPELAPLGNYGGPTATHPPLPTSPAIDAGDDSIAASYDLVHDQRGMDRIVDWDEDFADDNVDIGAVELAIGEDWS
jgi:hypothetical protein